MPSGKRSKQQRREGAVAVKGPPPVRSKGVGARPRQASPRALAIGGGVLLLVIVGIAVALVFSRGGGSSWKVPSGTPTIGSTGAEALPGAAQAAALFKGIPQHGLELGSPKAPVRMVMFIDLQCPRCQEYELAALPTIVRKYVRTGKVRIELKPWAFIGPDSVRGQLATNAAALQNKAFVFDEVLYLHQGTENTGWLDDSAIAQIASSVPGLNVPKLFADHDSAAVQEMQSQSDALAASYKVTGTPTVFVGRSTGPLKVVGANGYVPTLQQTKAAIDSIWGK